MDLKNGSFKLNVKDLIANIGFEYELYSEHLILADIGIGNISLVNTTMILNSSTHIDKTTGLLDIIWNEL